MSEQRQLIEEIKLARRTPEEVVAYAQGWLVAYRAMAGSLYVDKQCAFAITAETIQNMLTANQLWIMRDLEDE